MADKDKRRGWPLDRRAADLEMTKDNRAGAERVAKWSREWRQAQLAKKKKS